MGQTARNQYEKEFCCLGPNSFLAEGKTKKKDGLKPGGTPPTGFCHVLWKCKGKSRISRIIVGTDKNDARLAEAANAFAGRPENKQLKKLSKFFDVSIAYLTGNSYNRHAEDDFGSEAVWLENVDFLEDMFEKATRLSNDSLMVIREMIERTLIADDAQGKLKPEGMYTVKITKHGDEEWWIVL